MLSKVSVIIPAYNRQEFVRECIESILAQTHEYFEIILVDDGSTDQTLAICREMAEKDARIKVLEQQHGGVSAARNVGIESATGEYLFFVDSDDVIHPRLMETLVHAMKNSGADMAGSDVVGVKEQNWSLVKERLERPSDPGETAHQTNEQALNAMFTRKSPIGCIGGVMMRRDLVGETRFRNDLFVGEDFLFIYENLIKGAAVEFLRQNWYYVRHHKSNSSWNYGYDGFYTRFLRRKLVWEREDALGRPEYAKRQKSEVVSIYTSCAEKKGVSKEDRRKMRLVMKQHRLTIVPALSALGKLQYYLSVYTPALYSRTIFTKLSAWKKKFVSLIKKSPPHQAIAKTKKDIRTDITANPKNYELLNRFLSMSVSTGDQVFSAFEELPGALSGRGKTDLERYVYVPGTRRDRVLLVAHADTVWDTAYGNTPSVTSFAFKDGVFYSTDPNRGIGADDRAGCAMLLALADCGHSLLLLTGEERGKKGAWYLRKHNRTLFRELNKHAFMIEFDWVGTGKCLFNQVDYTPRFKQYIETQLNVHTSTKGGGCDLQVLCHKICGVNLSVGYHHIHTPNETLILAEWEDMYNRMTTFLQKEHPRFPIHKGKRMLRFARKIPLYANAAQKRFFRIWNKITNRT